MVRGKSNSDMAAKSTLPTLVLSPKLLLLLLLLLLILLLLLLYKDYIFNYNPVYNQLQPNNFIYCYEIIYLVLG